MPPTLIGGDRYATYDPPMTRFVVVGAGAIGGVVGARLHESGADVLLVARGRHAEVIAADGLTLVEPDRQITLPVPVVTRIADVRLGASDRVLLAVKTQDTPAVLSDLADAPREAAVCCFQNGVVNERVVGAVFPNTYGVVVMMPAAHLEPGRVEAYASPIPGLFDVGRADGGVDDVARGVADALTAAGFDGRAVPDVLRWKHTKLLMNLGNAVEAMCVLDDAAVELVGRARREGVACFEAAGIDAASGAEERERRGDLLQVREIAGAPRGGGSSWQSLARGLGTIEADALNGEIVRIGERVGVPTPVNALLRDRAIAAAAARIRPGSIRAAELLAALD